MNLYEINHELELAFERAVDPETGEINEEALGYFKELEMAKEEKEENVALWIKNLKADLEAYRAEKKRFDEKIRGTDNKIERLKRYLSDSLQGEKLKTTRVSVYSTTSQKVELKEGCTLADVDDQFCKVTVELDKVAISKALKAGEEVNGVQLVQSTLLVIR